MKNLPIYFPNPLPVKFLNYSSKTTSDENGNVCIVPIVEEILFEDYVPLDSDAYPTLEAQLKAGVNPPFVDPRIESVHVFELDNDSTVNSLLEEHSEIISNSNSNNSDNNSN